MGHDFVIAAGKGIAIVDECLVAIFFDPCRQAAEPDGGHDVGDTGHVGLAGHPVFTLGVNEKN